MPCPHRTAGRGLLRLVRVDLSMIETLEQWIQHRHGKDYERNDCSVADLGTERSSNTPLKCSAGARRPPIESGSRSSLTRLVGNTRKPSARRKLMHSTSRS